jgi:hypothetical protein
MRSERNYGMFSNYHREPPGRVDGTVDVLDRDLRHMWKGRYCCRWWFGTKVPYRLLEVKSDDSRLPPSVRGRWHLALACTEPSPRWIIGDNVLAEDTGIPRVSIEVIRPDGLDASESEALERLASNGTLVARLAEAPTD